MKLSDIMLLCTCVIGIGAVIQKWMKLFSHH